jgi:hypothetical protein
MGFREVLSADPAAKRQLIRTNLSAHRSPLCEQRRPIFGAGLAVLARVEQGLLEKSVLRGWPEGGLTDVEDRALFGLPARLRLE